MKKFELDPRLKADTFELENTSTYNLLLMNNALYLWLILVPKTDCIELIDLPKNQKEAVLEKVDQLSQCLKNKFPIDKLNVAALGNVVSQLHIHVVGRKIGDSAWPAPVWGHPDQKDYTLDQVEAIKAIVCGEIH
ncbi:HIT family protein [Francisellaceae bacterium]|nr:HIT family protein [Francisellaceae bacterium]